MEVRELLYLVTYAFFSFKRRYKSDYLELATNPLKDKYVKGMENLFKKYKETRVLFADESKRRFTNFV